MFLVKLTNFEPLLDATSYLAQISNYADVKFTPLEFYLIAPYPSPRFVATLQLSQKCFTNYSVDHEHTSKVDLESFHDAILDGGSFASMTIHLLEKPNQMILRFQTPSSEIPPLHHELTFSPPQLADNNIGGQLEEGKFFIVKSEALRRIIKELPIFQDDSVVCVGVTSSQIKFSIASKEIVLKAQHCRIVGFEEEVETQFQIILRPMLFFLNFTYKANKVWFYKTKNNSYSVMAVPAFGILGQYVIYFPPTAAWEEQTNSLQMKGNLAKLVKRISLSGEFSLEIGSIAGEALAGVAGEALASVAGEALFSVAQADLAGSAQADLAGSALGDLAGNGQFPEDVSAAALPLKETS
ncbi:uncharacterized protein LOC120067580 [Benincasa hispida]|uniref:uncharacterized protein LOC120067580 n=1 Tax=Benincasa hispida TaxID=102211 RepID=UPI0018FF49A3|nr:uncharacterized protein LOC120067580 [Benincasa hispida]